MPGSPAWRPVARATSNPTCRRASSLVMSHACRSASRWSAPSTSIAASAPSSMRSTSPMRVPSAASTTRLTSSRGQPASSSATVRTRTSIGERTPPRARDSAQRDHAEPPRTAPSPGKGGKASQRRDPARQRRLEHHERLPFVMPPHLVEDCPLRHHHADPVAPGRLPLRQALERDRDPDVATHRPARPDHDADRQLGGAVGGASVQEGRPVQQAGGPSRQGGVRRHAGCPLDGALLCPGAIDLAGDEETRAGLDPPRPARLAGRQPGTGASWMHHGDPGCDGIPSVPGHRRSVHQVGVPLPPLIHRPRATGQSCRQER